jgi:hypothetical protein
VGVALVIDWKRTDVVCVETLEWIIGCKSEWNRLNEDFWSWALAYELGDCAVRDRGIFEEYSALLQTPVADHGVVYCSNLFKNCIGYEELPFQHGTGRSLYSIAVPSRSL